MQITVRSPSPRRARTLQERLAGDGVEAMALVGPAEARAPVYEDIAALDVEAGGSDWAREIVSALRTRACPPAAIVALAPLSCSPEQTLSFDAWAPIDAPAGLIGRSLHDVHRSALARTELEARQETMREPNAAFPQGIAQPAVRTLFVGDPHPLFLPMQNALVPDGGRVEAAFSSFSGFDLLHDFEFDAILLNAMGDPAMALMLCGALRRNKRLHHLPTIVLTPADDTAEKAVSRGATLVLGPDASPDAGVAWILEKVRCGRLGRSVETQLLSTINQNNLGVFGEAFFERHLDRLAERAHQRGGVLSIAGLQVAPAPGAAPVAAPEWRRAVAHIAVSVRNLVRSHDTVALLDDDTIVVAFPCADLAGARRAIARVSAVAECSAFAGSDPSAGPVALARNVTELAPGESGGRLLTRTRDVFHVLGAQA